MKSFDCRTSYHIKNLITQPLSRLQNKVALFTLRANQSIFIFFSYCLGPCIFIYMWLFFLISDRNVLKLTPLSHKYLMAPLSERCKDTLTIWLEKLRAKSCRDKNSKDKRTIRQMLTILKTAADFDLDSVVALAENYFASFSCSVYINRKHSFDEECSKIYFSLPDRVRMKVAELRLSHTENEQFVD